jgi:hypothetical protein
MAEVRIETADGILTVTLADVDSGARGPLVFLVGLLDLLDTKLELLDTSRPRYALTA